MARTTAFESYSDAYDEWFEKNSKAYAAELKAIKKFVPEEGLRGVEIGVGSGKFAEPLKIGIGVEPSTKMAEKADQLGIEVLNGVAEDLPLADDDFDFALMVTTICFVDDPLRAFAEIRRVLKADGFAVVAFVDKESELGRQYQANRHKSRFYGEATFYSTQEVLKLLNSSGFECCETVQTLIPGADELSVLEGYGRGAFVVIKASRSA